MPKETFDILGEDLTGATKKAFEKIMEKINNGERLTKKEKELYLALAIEPDPVVEELRRRREIPTSPGKLRDISDSQKI